MSEAPIHYITQEKEEWLKLSDIADHIARNSQFSLSKRDTMPYLPSNPFPQPPPTLTAGLMVMCGARPPMLVVLISPTANRGGAALGGISPPLTGCGSSVALPAAGTAADSAGGGGGGGGADWGGGGGGGGGGGPAGGAGGGGSAGTEAGAPPGRLSWMGSRCRRRGSCSQLVGFSS